MRLLQGHCREGMALLTLQLLLQCQVVCVVNNFRGRHPEREHVHAADLAHARTISIPRAESPLGKNHITAFAEVT